jgi:hypothetical protein
MAKYEYIVFHYPSELILTDLKFDQRGSVYLFQEVGMLDKDATEQ